MLILRRNGAEDGRSKRGIWIRRIIVRSRAPFHEGYYLIDTQTVYMSPLYDLLPFHGDIRATCSPVSVIHPNKDAHSLYFPRRELIFDILV